MSSYDGDAVVVADGVEYPCRAQLTGGTTKMRPETFADQSVASGLSRWGGVIALIGGTDAAWAVEQASQLSLRIGDREGDFVPADGGDLNAATFPINGSGHMPFD